MDPSSSLRIDDYSRLLFDEATDGVFIANPEGIYLAVNRSGHQILGYENGELIGKKIAAVVSEREISRIQPALAALFAGEVFTEFWTMLRKDGKTIDVEVRSQKLSNGTLLGIVRVPDARDEYERKILISEAKLWSILHTAPDIILTVDRDGKILFINRTLPPMTVDQVIGMSCYDFVPPESRSRVAQAIEYVFATREIDSYEVRRPSSASELPEWSSVRVGPLIKDDQVIAVTMCATDVSEYKREVARTQELLERLHKIASLVPGMVFQFRQRADGTGCFPYASDYIRVLFQLSPESVRDNATAVFSKVHPDDLAGITQAIRDSATTWQPIHHEFRIVLDNNTVRWLSGDTAAPEQGLDDSLLWHGFLTDITERKEAEKLRARLEDQLMRAHKMDSIGQLAGGVAHDFNNLLTIINGFVDLTLEELPAATMVHAYLEGIKGAAARGAALTQQLVAFARKKIVRPENVNLNSGVNQMVPMIRRLVGEHIDVQLHLADDLHVVSVDVGSMEQVLMNLVVNARDAMTDGGILKVITQMTTIDAAMPGLQPDLRPGEYVVLSVSDTGCGISAEVRNRLFEPFFTTKPKGAGTGLGLAMCHGIVTQAGGIIAVRSTINVGTTIDIYLPSKLGVPAENQVTTIIETSAGSETILIVEDEPLILQLISGALKKLGYQVLVANDGIEALAVASNSTATIDLLVTDVVMPRLGGRELAIRLQQHRPTLQVLFMSGYAENALAHQGELPHGLNFIQKPFQPVELARYIRRILDQVSVSVG